MTKTELMETYTAEQLAEMVVELQNGKGNKVFKVKDNKNYQKEIDEFFRDSVDKICNDILEQKNNAMAMEFTRIIGQLLRENGALIRFSQVEIGEDIHHNIIERKYGIVFDSVDFSEHDKEFTDKIKELQSEVEKYRKAFEDAKKEFDCQIVEYQKKMEELTAERDFLAENSISTHQDPIDIAKDLINAEGEYEHNAIAKALYKEDKGTYRIFDIGELRQIAEHLLLYCNHNGKVE